ncbi:MAG: cytochrome c oxidase subunit 3 [Acidimicrobiales bacterium]
MRAAEEGDRSRAVRWLLATIGLGALFVANQALEYTELPFSISTDAYGSIFYLMTGFHGLHVLGGLGFMAAVITAIAGRSSQAHSGATVAVCAYYWHFVDVVWVAMFATLYLLK